MVTITRRFRLSLWLFGCLWTSAVAQTPEIIRAPSAELVPFNQDDNVTFSCTVRGSDLIWQVNNAQLVTPNQITEAQSIGIFPEIIDNGDGTLSGTLQITVRESNVNKTRIRCLAVGGAVLERNVSDFINLTTFAVPESPRNFQLMPSGTQDTLTIRWDPPSNTPPDVPTTHDVEVVNINTTEDYPNFPQNNLMLDTTLLVFDELVTRCSPFQFRVTATNDAGTSEPSIINETIPISPNVTPINDGLRAQNGISVSFSSSDVTITLTFQRATSCSINFPVMEHIITVESVSSVSTADLNNIITHVIGPTDLVADSVYTISVTASSGVTRRTSDAFQVYTTDVQTAMVDYVESDNRVFLTCTFATGGTAQGCVFIFTLRNETERFSVTREGGEGTQCNTTTNNAGSYDTVQVVDWESDGSEGALRRTIQPEPAVDEAVFSDSCPLSDTAGLSGGEIAGIVVGVAVTVVIVAAVVVVVIVFYYRQKKITASAVMDASVSDAEKTVTDGEDEVDTGLLYQCVGKLDPSDPKSMKIKLDQQVVQKILEQRKKLKQHPKKLNLYYEKF